MPDVCICLFHQKCNICACIHIGPFVVRYYPHGSLLFFILWDALHGILILFPEDILRSEIDNWIMVHEIRTWMRTKEEFELWWVWWLDGRNGYPDIIIHGADLGLCSLHLPVFLPFFVFFGWIQKRWQIWYTHHRVMLFFLSFSLDPYSQYQGPLCPHSLSTYERTEMTKGEGVLCPWRHDTSWHLTRRIRKKRRPWQLHVTVSFLFGMALSPPSSIRSLNIQRDGHLSKSTRIETRSLSFSFYRSRRVSIQMSIHQPPFTLKSESNHTIHTIPSWIPLGSTLFKAFPPWS